MTDAPLPDDDRQEGPIICSRCSEPSEGWPNGEGGELCQEHWEADCDASWWENLTGPGPMIVMDLP